MARKEFNLKAIGRKVYVVTKEGGWYGTIKDATEDQFLVANSRNGRESLVDIFDVRVPEDPVLE